MKWTIDYIPSGNYFRVTGRGIYEKGDTEDMYRELFSHAEWSPRSAVLRDMRMLDFRKLTYRMMSNAVNAIVSNENRIGSARIAFLVDSEVGYGVCRQIQMLIEANTSLQTEIFREETAAIEWLTSHRSSGAEKKVTNLL